MVHCPSSQGSAERRVTSGFGPSQPTMNFGGRSEDLQSNNNLSYWLMCPFLTGKNLGKPLKEKWVLLVISGVSVPHSLHVDHRTHGHCGVTSAGGWLHFGPYCSHFRLLGSMDKRPLLTAERLALQLKAAVGLSHEENLCKCFFF